MNYLRVRSIEIDVLPNGDPFIAIGVEQIIADDEGNAIQTIGNFDRLYRRLSDVPMLPIGTVADDGLIDPMEVYTILAQISYSWVIEKHGGQLINGKLVID